MAYVYILKGSRFYIGCTKNIQQRLQQHRSNKCHTTKRIGDWDIFRVIEVENMTEARTLERKIKKSGHPERWQ